MIETLQARQGAVAGVLRRLEAAGVVSAETAHVLGGSRRVKVYRLTDRGRQIAREIRSTRVEGTSPKRRR
jgi:DNA-binding PadR family transcriptional regulator